MSGESKDKTTGLSRRDFIRIAGTTGAAAGLPGLVTACGSDNDSRAPGNASNNASFPHGVASGDPQADRVMLWTRVTGVSRPTRVNWTIARDPEFSDVVNSGHQRTSVDRDFTVKVDADGLESGTTYYYRFSSGGNHSPAGRTKTLPSGAVDHVRFAAVSCSSLPHGFFNAYRRIAERQDLDFVLHLGDYIYEYPGVNPGGEHDYADGAAIAAGRQYSADNQLEIVSLGDYRRRFANYRLDPDLQELHRQYAFINIWDDHELANDAWTGGAENHQPDTEGDWAIRNANARQAFFEWLPIRAAAPGDTMDIERSFKMGDLVELMTLDTRLAGRDQQPAGIEIPGVTSIYTDMDDISGEDRQLLGANQEARLISQLQSSTARWKLIGQQVVFAQWRLVGLPNLTNILNPGGQGGVFINVDQWNAYPRARERIWNAIRGGQAAPNVAIDNIVIITGDVHSSWAEDITEDPTNIFAYDPLTGDGSMAVEFVCPSVTSPAEFPDTPVTVPVFLLQNLHIKFGDIQNKGYILIDVTPERCQSEWYFVGTHLAPNDNEYLAHVFKTNNGANRNSAGAASEPRADSPELAPAV